MAEERTTQDLLAEAGETLLKEFGLESASPEVKGRMLAEMVEAVQANALTTALSVLNQEGHLEFESLLERDEETIFLWLEKNFKNWPLIIAEEARKYRAGLKKSSSSPSFLNDNLGQASK